MAELRLAYDVYVPPGDREENLPPVVLLHGMLDSRKTWKYIAPEIARNTGRKVYALDARNHGESPWSECMTFDILADDLDSFLTQNAICRATIVGHSMGGRTALTLALKKPERVEKLVVEDMNLRQFRPSKNSPIVMFANILQESLQAIPQGAGDGDARRAIAHYIKSLMGNRVQLDSRRTMYDRSMIPLKRDGDGYAWQTNFKAIQKFLTTDKVVQPLSGVYMGDALFLFGPKSFFKVDQDTLIPVFFPKVTRVGVENSDHLVHFEYPERFVQEVTDFINGHKKCKSKY